MVQYSDTSLELSFGALADPTRRGIIDRLGKAEASITSLADLFGMSLTGMKKHVQVLERAGLVATQKVGRVRNCRLGTHNFSAEAELIESYRRLFEERFALLDEIIGEMKKEERNE